MDFREAARPLLILNAHTPLDLLLYLPHQLLVPVKRVRLLIEGRIMALVPFGQVRLPLEKLVPTWAKPFTDALGFWVVLLSAS